MSEDINFTEIDPAVIKDEFLAKMEQSTGEILYPGDERRIFAEGVCYALSVFISATNEACRSRLLAYASGYALDALGERVGCERLKPHPARTTLEFSLASARPNNTTIIPAGRRVTADNTVFFATDREVSIPPGEISVQVTATATVGGSMTNGMPVNSIQTIVDHISFVAGVKNLTMSSGGDDGEPYPIGVDQDSGDDGTGDENYRERIRMAPSSFSTAGTAAGYEYFVKSANANVGDVKVLSDQQAGKVDIYLVEKDGGEPSQEMMEEISALVNSDDIKPLNDLVEVHPAEPVPYGINMTFYCPEAQMTSTELAIRNAVEKYKVWQGSMIGRDINPDKLKALCLEVCNRVDVVLPTYTPIPNSRIARWDNETLSIQFIKEEE